MKSPICSVSCRAIILDTSYAVSPSNAFKPATAWYPRLRLWFGFALVERKTELPLEIQYRSAEGLVADCVRRVIE